MAGKPISGDGLAPSLAGMSKTQLYDIMCQMKTLIEQNQAQARQILIDNPLLTRALFQAQIMLGMVQAPQAIPNILPQAPQQSQQPVQTSQLSQQPVQPSKQSQQQLDQCLSSQVGPNDPRNVSKVPIPHREQRQKQYSMPVSSSSTQVLHSQPMTSHSLPPPKSHGNAQGAPMPLPQTSQVPTMPSHPIHSGSQPSPLHQPPMPPMSSHLQQPTQSTSLAHLGLQPPLLPQHRPPASAVPHQMQSHMGPSMNFQHPGIPPSHHSQPMYHPNIRPPSGMGSLTHGQPPLPSQPLPQSLYQGGGPHLVADFNNQLANSMQMERGSQWPPVPADGSQVGPPLMVPQAGIGNQPVRPPPLTPEMEQALLQQVMSLTPEQISLLPPEQRQQVLQLQQMLRQ